MLKRRLLKRKVNEGQEEDRHRTTEREKMFLTINRPKKRRSFSSLGNPKRARERTE